MFFGFSRRACNPQRTRRDGAAGMRKKTSCVRSFRGINMRSSRWSGSKACQNLNGRDRLEGIPP
jgi:hypothetical protein